ncbi:MAG: hypothetical protein U1E22_01250 [Coriobacteriia bacterium]|nr:hypothetical protein [Coriobacteriia bacterium]
MGRKVLSAIAGVLAAAFMLVLVMHVLITPVSPRQEAPERHIQTACWACHFTSSSAKIVD